MLPRKDGMKKWWLAVRMVLAGTCLASTAAELTLTAGERAAWARLTRRVADATPSHRICLRDGQEFVGWPLDITTNSVRWAAPLGADGRMIADFAAAEASRIEPLVVAPPTIDYCDVSFQLEFPALRLIRRPPYSLLTDVTPTRAERYLKILAELHAAWRVRFGELTEGLGLPDHVQVLVFSQEDEFRSYQRRVLGRDQEQTGFYTPAQLRLALFDQRQTTALEESLDFFNFDSEKRQVRARTDDEAEAIRFHDWTRALDVLREAEQNNRRILRHEGTHQLFHAAGILVEDATPGWVAEGLALWCEPREFGMAEQVYVGRVKTALTQNKLLPLAELMGPDALRARGFFAGDRRRDLAYAEAWSLVRLLLRPSHQPGFFNYLRYLRNRDALVDVRRTPPVELLSRFMGLTPAELETHWQDSIRRLPLDSD